MIYQFGLLFTGSVNVAGLIAALLVLGLMLFMLFRRSGESNKSMNKA